MYTVVYLVDNRRRDLAVACLISMHLEKLGIRCKLEPLESYQAVLEADRPDMIIFNHLLAGHLVRYSHRLRELGVLVAVLPNEGIVYEQSDLMFNAGQAHNNAHIDLFFSWNKAHQEALHSVGFGRDTQIEVVGVPRFDFYFDPWAEIFRSLVLNHSKPRVLICTNFVFAKFADLPPEECEKFFMHWKVHIKRYKDYWGAVKVSQRNRERLFSYLQPLAASAKYDIVLRVHPNEDSDWYRKRLENFQSPTRDRIRLDSDTNITQLILGCDIEISMDSCTTALESWIAGKPTFDLELERHEVLSNPLLDPLNQRCFHPADIVEQVDVALANPTQDQYREARKAHLARWCASPQGDSAFRISKKIADTLARRETAPFFKFRFADFRRGLKLRTLRFMDKPYNWQPQIYLRSFYNSSGAHVKRKTIEKSITPTDVLRQLRELKTLIRDNNADGPGEREL